MVSPEYCGAWWVGLLCALGGAIGSETPDQWLGFTLTSLNSKRGAVLLKPG